MQSASLKSRTLLISLTILVVCQVAYLYVNVTGFRRTYRDAVVANILTAGETLKTNLDYILQLGIQIDKLVGIKPMLKDMLGNAPVVSSICIQRVDGSPLYYADREIFVQGQACREESQISRIEGLLVDSSYDFSLQGFGGEELGKLVLSPDQKLLNRRVREIILDSSTVVVISLLAALDFLFFIVAYTISFPMNRAAEQIRISTEKGLLDRPVTPTDIEFLDRILFGFERFRSAFHKDWLRLGRLDEVLGKALEAQGLAKEQLKWFWEQTRDILGRFHPIGDRVPRIIQTRSPELIRPAVFLFVFSEALTVSFLPLYARQLYRPLWNLSEDVVSGLPIAAFMLFMGISLPLGAVWSERVGRKKAFLIGAVTSGAGLFLSGMAPDVVWLIVFRSFAALGYGIVFMTCQGYIVDTTTVQNRAEGMAIFISAFYGGVLCGSAIGGMLAERLGYTPLFYIGAGFSVASAVFIYIFIQEKRTTDTVIRNRQRLTWRQWVRLLTDRDFLALVVLQSIPSKICLIGLVYYMAPLFLRDMNLTQSDIGRMVMTYSLVMILFGPPISRWADRQGSIKPFIVWGGVLSGISLMPFFFTNSYWMVAAGIVLLGFSHTLSVPGQAKMATQLPSVREVGVAGGFGVYRSAERVGNVIAPILIGVMAATMGFAQALAIVGAYTLLSSLLFILVCRKQESPARK